MKSDDGVRSVDEIKKYINFNESEESLLREVVERHPMLISYYYLGLINPDDPFDPLRKMMIPSLDELDAAGEYDTSGERTDTKIRGLQHKYRETALLLITSRCASYCRYCFRKRMVGLDNDEVLDNLEAILDYIRHHTEISNVLVSGGDPLVLPTPNLKRLLEGLNDIGHLDFIRIGSKIPVVLPDRIIGDSSLLSLFERYSRPDRRLYLVTQFNHPREISPKATAAVDAVLSSGVVINNQTTLLEGVNDSPEVLAELLAGLTRIGITPYYVFHCRPVKRVKNSFQLPLHRGIEIVERAKAMLNGPAKRFKYAMSHTSGKIEILGKTGTTLHFKYHQAKKPELAGRFFSLDLPETAGWLDPAMVPSS
ncbi:MAG: KamA family radical SAM protein [Spirochaetia bacterium]